MAQKKVIEGTEEQVKEDVKKRTSLPVKSVTEEIIDGESVLIISADDITVKVNALTVAKKYGGSFVLREVRSLLTDENRNDEGIYLFTDIVKEKERDTSVKVNKKVKEAVDTAKLKLKAQLEANGLDADTIATILENSFN